MNRPDRRLRKVRTRQIDGPGRCATRGSARTRVATRRRDLGAPNAETEGVAGGICVHFTFDMNSAELSGEFDCGLVIDAQVEVELEGVVGVAPSWWAGFSPLKHEERKVPSAGAYDNSLGGVVDPVPLVDELLVEAGENF